MLFCFSFNWRYRVNLSLYAAANEQQEHAGGKKLPTDYFEGFNL